MHAILMQTVLTQTAASTAHVGKALKEMDLIAQVCNWTLPFIASVIMEPLLSTCITPSVASCANVIKAYSKSITYFVIRSL